MRPSFPQLVTLAALPLTAALLTACGSNGETPQAQTVTVATTVTGVASTSSAPATSSSAREAYELQGSRDVAKVRETFATLAPKEFFDKLASCDSNGIPDSFACTGPEIGQFQFIAGDAKAAATTQLLTELRSSRVVEDSGDRIVGWSTLGTTAVITVVDNKKGLTMQQIVSSDKQDPLQRIKQLGLVQQRESVTPSPSQTAQP